MFPDGPAGTAGEDVCKDPCDSNDHDAGVPGPHALRGLLVEQEPARSHLCRYTVPGDDLVLHLLHTLRPGRDHQVFRWNHLLDYYLQD